MNLASKKNNRGLRGFTLVELLVVIAIIGISSAVVLAALNTARSKGNDAAAKSNLGTIQTQAAIYYDSNNAYSVTGAAVAFATGAASSYANCSAAHTLFADNNVVAAIAGAVNAEGASSPLCQIVAGATTAWVSVAGANASSWDVYVPLKNPATGTLGWCVDSNGKAEASNAPVAPVVASGTNGAVCP